MTLAHPNQTPKGITNESRCRGSHPCQTGTRVRSAKGARAFVAPTRKEDGCIRYDLFVDLDDPTKFTFIEEWESREALDKHGKSDHIAIGRAAFPELWLSTLGTSRHESSLSLLRIAMDRFPHILFDRFTHHSQHQGHELLGHKAVGFGVGLHTQFDLPVG